METANNIMERVLTKLVKEPLVKHTATSLATALEISRQGLWKTLYKLFRNKLIILEPIGKTKTSTSIIKLNLDNPVTEKTISLLLTKEAMNQQRWWVNFTELKDDVSFLLLFGSILYNSKEAKDIDIMAVIDDTKKFKIIDNKILKIQQTQIKKIHFIDLTSDEFKQELRRPNKAYVGALKKGVVLYGQDNFIQFIKGLIQK